MSPRRPTTRRDSFGLEIREDGTIGFNLSPDVRIAAADSDSQRPGVERRECEDGSPRSTGSDSWKNIVSLTRTKRRRDSTANVESKSSGNTTRKTNLVGIGGNGLRRTKTQPGRNRRRRDSFGLEIREDGTLSLDQLAGPRPLAIRSSGDNSSTHDERSRNVHRNGAGGQESEAAEVVQRNRTRPAHSHPRNQNHTSNSNSINGHATNPPREQQPRTNNRAVQGRANNVEVETLRERVRVLEAALAQRGPHANNAMEQLPEYQSRPCSPTAGRRFTVCRLA